MTNSQSTYEPKVGRNSEGTEIQMIKIQVYRMCSTLEAWTRFLPLFPLPSPGSWWERQKPMGADENGRSPGACPRTLNWYWQFCLSGISLCTSGWPGKTSYGCMDTEGWRVKVEPGGSRTLSLGTALVLGADILSWSRGDLLTLQSLARLDTWGFE